MVPRQQWLFQLGCWVALATAVMHMIAHVTGALLVGAGYDPALEVLLPTHVWLVPGLWQPSFAGVLDGFSLTVAMLTATLGASGLVVLRFANDADLTRRLARVFAIGMSMCLLVSIVTMFSVETFFVATVALCFGLASVKPE
jgi:hypothetical protein